MNVTICKHSCEVEALYQWDRGQTLRILGLSLPTAPDIHFSHRETDTAVVRQSTMDAAGVITVGIPDDLLELPYDLKVHICTDAGAEFCTLSDFTVPVNKREKPGIKEEG